MKRICVKKTTRKEAKVKKQESKNGLRTGVKAGIVYSENP